MWKFSWWVLVTSPTDARSDPVPQVPRHPSTPAGPTWQVQHPNRRESEDSLRCFPRHSCHILSLSYGPTPLSLISLVWIGVDLTGFASWAGTVQFLLRCFWKRQSPPKPMLRVLATYSSICSNSPFDKLCCLTFGKGSSSRMSLGARGIRLQGRGQGCSSVTSS